MVYAYLALLGLALLDLGLSRLTASARILWVLVLLFLPVVGLIGWLLTRRSAHLPPPEETDGSLAAEHLYSVPGGVLKD